MEEDLTPMRLEELEVSKLKLQELESMSPEQGTKEAEVRSLAIIKAAMKKLNKDGDYPKSEFTRGRWGTWPVNGCKRSSVRDYGD